MSTIPITFRIDKSLKADLESIANSQDRAIGSVVARLVERHIASKKAFDAEMSQAVAEADAGTFVSSQAVYAWMDSLDEDSCAVFPDPDITLG